MSYILNALRKSEQERKQGEVDAGVVSPISVVEDSTPVLRLSKWMLLFMAGNVFLLVFLLLRIYRQPNSNIAVQTDSMPLVSVTAMQSMDKPGNDHVLHIENSTLSVVDPKQDLALAVEKPSAEVSITKPKEIKKSATEKTKEKKQGDVAEQKVKQEQRVMAALKPEQVTTSMGNKTDVIAGDPSLNDTLQTTPKSSVREYKVPSHDPNNLIPLWSQLPEELRAQIPKLTINVFAYAESAKDRFLIVDMAKYKIGDSVKEGIVLQNILPESAVFVYNSQRFRLERP